MFKRFFCLILCASALLASACGQRQAGPDASPTHGPGQEGAQEEGGQFNSARHLIGFVVRDDNTMDAYAQMHGFLRTAQNLYYPARLYAYTAAGGALAAVDQARQDGCEALLFFDAQGLSEDALQQADSYGMRVVTSYTEHQSPAADGAVVADREEYLGEMARGIATRMVERNLKAGRLMVYGFDTQAAAGEITDVIRAEYPQYQVTQLARTQQGEEAAINELAAFIYHNRDVKGMFCTDADSTQVAVKARALATKMLKGTAPTPAPAPTPTPDPAATPVPEALLKEILITLFGTQINRTNLNLMASNDIYGVVAYPHYEAAAQGTMLLDALLRGGGAAAVIKVNIPIVRQDTRDKYVAIYQQIIDSFGLEES